LAAQLIDLGLGLDDQRLSYVESYYNDLIDQGYDDEEAGQLISQYYQDQLEGRALTIARTETMLASDAGQLEAWQQVADAGLIEPDTQRAWLTTPDEKLCPICAVMDGVQTGINEPWTLSTGEDVMTPAEAHPNCRCAQYLVVGDIAVEESVAEPLVAARVKSDE
jgi:hypothetical protein